MDPKQDRDKKISLSQANNSFTMKLLISKLLNREE